MNDGYIITIRCFSIIILIGNEIILLQFLQLSENCPWEESNPKLVFKIVQFKPEVLFSTPGLDNLSPSWINYYSYDFFSNRYGCLNVINVLYSMTSLKVVSEISRVYCASHKYFRNEITFYTYVKGNSFFSFNKK